MLELDFDMQVGNLALTVELASESERLALVGPSGSGKTTVLRVVAGLEESAEGRVAYRGDRWQGGDGTFVPPWKRNVGWLPQDSLVFPHLTARANLKYAGPTKKAFDEVVDILELDEYLDAKPRTLSGGERQRVALGRALLSGPSLLLLDEPFSALDQRLTGRLEGFLDEWADRQNCGVFMTSHTRASTEVLADDVFRISDGRLVSQ